MTPWTTKRPRISSSLDSPPEMCTRPTDFCGLSSTTVVVDQLGQPGGSHIASGSSRPKDDILGSKDEAEDLYKIVYAINSILLYFQDFESVSGHPADTGDRKDGQILPSRKPSSSDDHKRRRSLTSGRVKDDRRDQTSKDSESDKDLHSKRQKANPPDSDKISRPFACPFCKFSVRCYYRCSGWKSARIDSVKRHVMSHTDYLNMHPHKIDEINRIGKTKDSVERWERIYMILFDVPAEQKLDVPNPYFVDPGACYRRPSPGDPIYDAAVRAAEMLSQETLEPAQKASRLTQLQQMRDRLQQMMEESVLRRQRAEQDEITSVAQIRARLAAEEHAAITSVRRLESQLSSEMGFEVHAIGPGALYPHTTEQPSQETTSRNQFDFARPNGERHLHQVPHSLLARSPSTQAGETSTPIARSTWSPTRGWPALTPDSGYWSPPAQPIFPSPSSANMPTRHLQPRESPFDFMPLHRHASPPAHLGLQHQPSPQTITEDIPATEPCNVPSRPATTLDPLQQNNSDCSDSGLSQNAPLEAEVSSLVGNEDALLLPLSVMDDLQLPGPAEDPFDLLEFEADTSVISPSLMPTTSTTPLDVGRVQSPSGGKGPERYQCTPRCRLCDNLVSTAGELCNTCQQHGYPDLPTLDYDFESDDGISFEET